MIPRLSDYITEARDYGCVMLFFDGDSKNTLLEFQRRIRTDHILEGEDLGLEKNPHVTILYGLHDDMISDDDAKEMLDNVSEMLEGEEILLKGIGSFTGNGQDVLKYDVDGPDSLWEANKHLTSTYRFTTDYPDYTPHITISYLKEGTAENYTTEDITEGMTRNFGNGNMSSGVLPTKLVYSRPNGKKIIQTINAK